MQDSADIDKQINKVEPPKRQWLIVALLVAMVVAIGALIVVNLRLLQQVDDKAKQVTSLEEKTSQLEAKLNNQVSKPTDDTPKVDDSTKACLTFDSSKQGSITSSITSGNTAALESYLANPSSVILAASEGVGPRTPTQAVADISSFISGSSDWNFLLPNIETKAFAAGFYKQYFPDDAIIGKASNNRVISFSPDCTGKIKTVFLATDSSLLLP